MPRLLRRCSVSRQCRRKDHVVGVGFAKFGCQIGSVGKHAVREWPCAAREPAVMCRRRGGVMGLSRAIGIVSPVFLTAAVLVAQNRAAIVDADSDAMMPRPARLMATAIPGAGAIAQVGTLHKVGPFAPGGALDPATHPVLERTRLLVASTSNFGAPLARPTEAPGSILSLSTALGVVNVPPDFANPNLSPPVIGTGQPYAAGGAVILYTAQSPPFLNGKNNPAAVTADRPSVSLPLGISLNNGFSRPWFATA